MENLNEKLLAACSEENLELITQILDSTSSNTIDLVNFQKSNGITPLILATSKGNLKIVELLISKGADINLKDNSGDTPLMCAAWNGYKEIAELLISKKADIIIQNKRGNSALFNAIIRKHSELAVILIDAGCNLNLQDNEGNTALNCSILNSQTEIALLLLTKGVDVNMLNKKGETALTLAIGMGLTEVTALLESKGATKTKSDLKLEKDVSKEIRKASAKSRKENAKVVEFWTGMLCILLIILNPMVLFLKLFLQIFISDSLSGQNIPPYLATIFNLELLSIIGLTILSVRAGIKLWKFAPNAVKIAKIFLILVVVFFIIDAFALRAVFSNINNQSVSNLLKLNNQFLLNAIVYCFFWFTYLSTSRYIRDSYKSTV